MMEKEIVLTLGLYRVEGLGFIGVIQGLCRGYIEGVEDVWQTN